ncbi:hypothetical protein QR680_001184 [Steinernema hermaphroditum]|uniref:PHD-type domain-containing protein n=1 Tax=Steinernema hermaphroditum TaxID=289476 RepID=A0AA39GY14_9BILA|nr:hypothetical protein QR680_001184 [Steinernema hermaphroditum]
MLVMPNEPYDLHGPPQLDPQAPTPEPASVVSLKRVEGVRYEGDMIEQNPRLRRVARVARGGFVQAGTGVRLVRILGSPLEKRPMRVAGERRLISAEEYARIRANQVLAAPYPVAPQQFVRKRVITEPRVETIDLTNETTDNDLVHEDEYRMVTGFAKVPSDPSVVPSSVPQPQPVRAAPVRYIRSTMPANVRGVPAMRPITAVSRPVIPSNPHGGSAIGARVMRQMIGRGGLVQRTIRRAPVNVARVGFKPLEPIKRPMMRRPPSMRFEFESNEEEERAIAQAIAHEEELMRQEEERERAKNANSLSLFPSLEGEFRRVEEGLRQKELATRSELERRRLAPSNPLLSTYTSPFARDAAHRHQQLIEQNQAFTKKSSNLAPSKDDTLDVRVAKQLLDTLITQVCKAEKLEKIISWQRPPPPQIRVREPNPRYPVMRFNQQETQLHEKMDILKREVLKRRQKIEEQAERETGITPPWKRSRVRTRPRPKKKPADHPHGDQTKKENTTNGSEIKMVEDPSQISLGGDSVVYTSNEPPEDTTPPDLNDLLDEVHHLTFDSHLQELTPEHLSILDPCNLLETEILEEGKLDEHSTNLSLSLSPKKSPPKGRRKSSPEKMKRESISEKSEASATTVSTIPAPPPRGRGRPPKSGKKDGAKASVPSLALDAAKCKCICKEAFDPRRFYIPCTACGRYYHGQCVGLGDKKSKRMKGFICDHCKKSADADVYCVCRKPYDSNQFYVGCDGCEGWFHPACVGTTQSEVEKHDTYLCPSCNGKTVSSGGRRR